MDGRLPGVHHCVALLLVLLGLAGCLTEPRRPEEVTADRGAADRGTADRGTADSRADAVVEPDDATTEVSASAVAADDHAADVQLYSRAEQLANQPGRQEEALELLRTLRVELPESEYLPRSLLLSAQLSLAVDQPYSARYFLKKLVSEPSSEQLHTQASLLLADLLYEEKMYAEAFEHYVVALRNETAVASEEIRARAHLRLAYTSYYVMNDKELAQIHFRSVPQALLREPDIALYAILSRRLIWEELTSQTLSLKDDNISAISVDEDDIWVGTWNGGVARYSLSSGQVQVFVEGRESLTANTVRAIEVTQRRVWVGTFQGLSYYSKATSKWHTVEEFARVPDKIQVVKDIDGTLFVGTLGRGLWRLKGDSWVRVAQGELPGDFIQALEHSADTLFIGTMTLGVLLLDLATERITSLDVLNPLFGPRNITMILSEGSSRTWVGTHGEGLVLWEKQNNELHFFTKEAGYLVDDYLQCGIATETGLYFGTLGGGVSFLSESDGTWRSIGLAQGLPSLIIGCISYAPPYVYIGTLGAGISILDEAYAAKL